MTKSEAAELLELKADASPDEVRGAFRQRYNDLTNRIRTIAYTRELKNKYIAEQRRVIEAAKMLGFEPWPGDTYWPVKEPQWPPPDNGVRELLDLGKKQLEQGKFTDAIGSFEAALKLDPENAEARLGIEKAKAAQETPSKGARNLMLPVAAAVAIGSALLGWLAERLAANGSFYYDPFSTWIPFFALATLLAAFAGILARSLVTVLHQRVEIFLICGWFIGWIAGVGFNLDDIVLSLAPGLLVAGIVLWRPSLLARALGRKL